METTRCRLCSWMMDVDVTLKISRKSHRCKQNHNDILCVCICISYILYIYIYVTSFISCALERGLLHENSIFVHPRRLVRRSLPARWPRQPKWRAANTKATSKHSVAKNAQNAKAKRAPCRETLSPEKLGLGGGQGRNFCTIPQMTFHSCHQLHFMCSWKRAAARKLHFCAPKKARAKVFAC